MRALAPGVRLFQPLIVPESVPQRLKPRREHGLAARLKPCPSYKEFFRSLFSPGGCFSSDPDFFRTL